MKLTNRTAYDTRALRKVIMTALKRAATGTRPRGWLDSLHITVTHGRLARTSYHYQKNHRGITVALRLPPLTGDEFIPTLRKHYGGPQKAVEVPPTYVLHDTCFHLFLRLDGHRIPRAVNAIIANGDVLPGTRENPPDIPAFLPLRIIKEKAKQPRDVIAERHARVVELEAKWQRKLKLAQTKLKKLRIKRKQYEKKIAARQLTQEEE